MQSQVTTCAERSYTRRHWQLEVRPPLHDELHWLDVPHWVFFKLAVTVHRCLNGLTPLRTCRTTVSLSPVLTFGGIYVLPTVSFLQYHTSGSTLTLQPSGLFSSEPHYLELSWTLFRSQWSVQTSLNVYLITCCGRAVCLDLLNEYYYHFFFDPGTSFPGCETLIIIIIIIIIKMYLFARC